MRAYCVVVLAVLATATAASLPDGPTAPVVVPQLPKPFWSWAKIPTSYHGANKERAFNDSEVERLAKYQMFTPVSVCVKYRQAFSRRKQEKWYTPCGSQGPTQAGPECAIEAKTEHLFQRIRAINPNQTTILYWNTM